MFAHLVLHFSSRGSLTELLGVITGLLTWARKEIPEPERGLHLYQKVLFSSTNAKAEEIEPKDVGFIGVRIKLPSGAALPRVDPSKMKKLEGALHKTGLKTKERPLPQPWKFRNHRIPEGLEEDEIGEAIPNLANLSPQKIIMGKYSEWLESRWPVPTNSIY